MPAAVLPAWHCAIAAAAVSSAWDVRKSRYVALNAAQYSASVMPARATGIGATTAMSTLRLRRSSTLSPVCTGRSLRPGRRW